MRILIWNRGCFSDRDGFWRVRDSVSFAKFSMSLHPRSCICYTWKCLQVLIVQWDIVSTRHFLMRHLKSEWAIVSMSRPFPNTDCFVPISGSVSRTLLKATLLPAAFNTSETYILKKELNWILTLLWFLSFYMGRMFAVWQVDSMDLHMFPCVVWQLAVPEMIFMHCTIRPGLWLFGCLSFSLFTFQYTNP